jgi:predicted Holliday junction resolvase-like endonuclease
MHLFIGCFLIIFLVYVLLFCIYYKNRLTQKISKIEQLEIDEQLKKEEDEKYVDNNDFIAGRAIYLKYKN